MKRAIAYLCLAVFCWLVIQPNLQVKMEPAPERIPDNTETLTTSNDVFQKTSTSHATVVIDPGRSAGDIGYDAPGKISEKEVSMQLAAALGEALEQAGYKVDYTRWYDTTEGWSDELSSDENRLQAAKSKGADYMISLRFNTGDSLEKGFSIFTRPDSEELESLSQTIADNIKAVSYSVYQGLDTDHYENFPVLNDENIPAVLLQMGYLSNDQDYAKITDPQFQQKIAQAIAQAFLDTVD